MYASYGRDISKDDVFAKGSCWLPVQQGPIAKIRALVKHITVRTILITRHRGAIIYRHKNNNNNNNNNKKL